MEPELDEVERQIARLKIEFERFFSGELKLMPIQARRRLESRFQRLWGIQTDRAADRFRLQTLQERYTSLAELWDKKQRAREEGRRLAPREAPGPASTLPVAAATPASSEPPRDGNAPASVKARPRPDFRPLFERYQAARRELGGEPSSKMTFERFEELVRQKAEEIRNRTGSMKLVFEIRTEGGKVRLVGRPAPVKG